MPGDRESDLERGAERACLNIAINYLGKLDFSARTIRAQVCKSSQAPESDGPSPTESYRSELDLHESLKRCSSDVDRLQATLTYIGRLGYYARLKETSEVTQLLETGFDDLNRQLRILDGLFGRFTTNPQIVQKDLGAIQRAVDELIASAFSFRDELQGRLQNDAPAQPSSEPYAASLSRIPSRDLLKWANGQSREITKKGIAALLGCDTSTLDRHREDWCLPPSPGKTGRTPHRYSIEDLLVSLSSSADCCIKDALDRPVSQDFIKNLELFCPRKSDVGR
jgi:hypothetical protein